MTFEMRELDMPQAMAVLLRKKLELTRELDNSQSDAADIENEIKALDRVIEFIKPGHLSKSESTGDLH